MRSILRGILLIELFTILPGIPYSLFVSHNLAVAAAMVFVIAFGIGFGVIVGRFLDASSGNISTAAVTVVPAHFLGFRLPGPEGTIPTQQFKAVRVITISPQPDPQVRSDWHTRVYLVGAGDTADLCIARAGVADGLALAHDLGAALGKPVEETSGPL